MAAEDLGDLQAEILEVKHAILEAPKQPKKQDETEAPPGWNRSRQGPEKGPNPDLFWPSRGRAQVEEALDRPLDASGNEDAGVQRSV